VQASDQPIVYVNDRFLEHTNYHRSEILGVNW
jgi:PAS domain-containing protein